MIRHTLSWTTLFATLLLGAWAAPAAAAGYWNLPSNFCQCVGCGFGAGHHVPLVLGPANCHGICAHNVVRLSHAPAVPYAGFDCRDCDQHFGEPTLLDPATAPTEPLPIPMTRRPRPLFLR